MPATWYTIQLRKGRTGDWLNLVCPNVTIRDILDTCSTSSDRKMVQVVKSTTRNGPAEEREIKWLYLEMSIGRLMLETQGDLMLMVLES